MPTCSYCNKNLATEKSLYVHKRRARYCLRIQGQMKIKESPFLICEGCEKSFVTKREFNNHEKQCCDFLNKEIQRLEEEINELKLQHEKEIAEIYKTMNKRKEACIEEIAKQPKTQNNISNKLTCLTPLDLNREKIDKAVADHFTIHHFFRGQKGIAEFAFEHLLKDEKTNPAYVCTDMARTIFGFKGKNGCIEKDLHAKKLTRMIMPSIMDPALKIMTERNDSAEDPEMSIITSDCYLDIANMERDNSKFRTELASLTG